MIPEKNDEVYLYPSFKEIIAKTRQNRVLRQKFFKKFNFFEFKENKVTIASGHQPYLFHAGIWAKTIFLNCFKDFEKVFITHDADVKNGLFLDIPAYTDKWKKLREYIYLNSENRTFEEYDNKKFEEGIKWFSEKFQEMKNYVKKDIKEKIECFIEFVRNHENPVQSLINTRKNFEKGISYKEIKVSEISKDSNFLKFFLYIFYNAQKFLDVYNHELKEFREIRGIKKQGEPFPFLLKQNNYLEIPFWYLKNGRKKLFKNRNYLYADNEKLCELTEKIEQDIEIIKKFKIRPRAFTLSIYQRVFVCDFFIHGYGGKLYDEFTEKVFEKIFDLKMPECGLLTGTFYIFPDNPENISAKLSSLYERKNFIIHHPEKFLKDDELVLKKQTLIKEIQRADNKKKISEEIKKINQSLKQKLKNLIEDIETNIKNLENQLNEQRVKYFREYPYFYIDFERVKKAIQDRL